MCQHLEAASRGAHTASCSTAARWTQQLLGRFLTTTRLSRRLLLTTATATAIANSTTRLSRRLLLTTATATATATGYSYNCSYYPPLQGSGMHGSRLKLGALAGCGRDISCGTYLQTFTTHGWGYGLLQADLVDPFLLQANASAIKKHDTPRPHTPHGACFQRYLPLTHPPPYQYSPPPSPA